jgi:hypothetical protein
LQDIEKLIYKILMWVILIPKTIVQITLHPRWASEYVRKELNEGEGHFDEYISPVILLLIVALLPSIGYNALPKFGATISSPAETNLTTDRFLSFEVQGDFISASPSLAHFAIWEVWKKNADGEYLLESDEFHPREDGNNAIQIVDNNTVKDRFLYTFGPGEYYVYASVGNVDVGREESPVIESYDAYITVVVPLSAADPVKVSSESEQALDAKAGAQEADFLNRVKDEQTIFLALALMMPPLLFAFVSKVFRGAIDENTLKDNFYLQCYYFSPLSLAIWGTYYSFYFFTADAYLYFGADYALPVLLFPLTLAVLWFVRTEIKNIAWERKAPIWKATILVVMCIGILGYMAQVIFSFDTYMNSLRLFAIRAFPILGLLLVAGYGFTWYRRRRQKKENILSWNIAGFAILGAVFLWVMFQFVGYTGFTSTAPVAVVEPQGTGVAVVVQATSTQVVAATQDASVSPQATPQSTPTVALSTPTPQPTPTIEPPRYYTEEFNAPLLTWFDFMTYGDSRMVDQKVDLGVFSVRLTPLEEKFSWYYQINNAFTYSDVRVETVVKNQGNNSNGISLVCRYSDVGWYEAVFSSSGEYWVYVVDNQGIVSQGYNEIANGGSALILQGLKTNVYALECRGNELGLFVNQEEIKRVTDNRFQLAEGKVGLAVSAPKKLPVNVDFESFTVSEP